jgi:ATP-dependent Lhr-like helicase
VGELDEEMVFETQVGETFTLGASTWRIEEITHDRVLVTPAPGEPGKMPFWHGDQAGRPVNSATRIGKLVREVRGMPRGAAIDRLVPPARSGHAGGRDDDAIPRRSGWPRVACPTTAR